MLLITSERFADHITPPGHPESPERAAVLEAVAVRLQADGAELIDPLPATREALLRVHTAAYVDGVDATRGRALMIDADTYTSPDTADVAALAAGAAVQAVDAVLDGRHPTAAALVRPPGHHAESARAMGFCFYNSVAVAAAHARSRGLARVAIVDYDVHHGNGTQEMFYADPSVLYVSTHQYPFYPGTGAAREIGVGPGVGFTVNFAMDAGSTDGDYMQVFESGVVPVAEQFQPELLLVSAGFDAHEADPLAQMRATELGLSWMTRVLRALADRVCGSRVVLVSEGGYALPALAASLEGALRALDDRPGTVSPPEGMRPATGRGDRALAAVRMSHLGRWKGL
jgi:acetoin utilization deacetylase AcuC-like enzyme